MAGSGTGIDDSAGSGVASQDGAPEVTDEEWIATEPVRVAFGELMRAAYERVKGKQTWQVFAQKVFFDPRKDPKVGDQARYLSQLRIEIPDAMTVRMLVGHCCRSGIAIPAELDRFRPRSAAARRPPVHATKTLSDALGLEKNKADASLDRYCGRYLLFALEAEQKVIVTSYLLSKEKGKDGWPIFQARRRSPEGDLARSLGAYFANDHQLYLVGTPVDSIERDAPGSDELRATRDGWGTSRGLPRCICRSRRQTGSAF